MSVITRINTIILVNALSAFYAIFTLVIIGIKYLKNPFRNPWAQKLKLEPPAQLTDPKYGVHKYIKVNNIKLHYVENGDPSKPLMLFIHGFPEFWYSWRYQLVEFSKDYWCVAVDMRGYADSERPEDVASYKIDVLIQDIRDLIRQLGRDNFILVAHDWGGLIACKFRDVHPDVLKAVVLLGTTSFEAFNQILWKSPRQRKLSWYVFLFRVPCIPELMLQMDDLQFFETLKVPGKDTINDEDIEVWKYWFRKQYALTPPINYYRANFNPEIQPDMTPKDGVPMLLMMADGDQFLTSELLEVNKKQYTNLETVLIEHCGHFMQQEEPVKINKHIRDFLVKNQI